MNSDTRFVCNIQENEEVMRAREELKQTQERQNQQLGFIKKQMQDFEDESRACWQAIFDAAKKTGLVESGASYEDYSLQIAGGSSEQLFMTPKSGQPNGLEGFIKGLVLQ